ncbi:type IV secretion system protein [Achromobacter xylosoxidans]|uniref:virB8 family protein n=1 Tax=Alcaligenes xylosoxydans xylosoxydans TaxID=85698 RepID=UPI001F06889F|nr:type IV secretion system protein [Achromobacter xylosoxidans]MCH1986462.1 type IV secretion system protein [Achromobacter xylosoxidans]MCH1993114.1 type IV secretion system protein [Achromobacter xylosoxidans]MCH4588273.1 type IV secretion system protein [Achromobacter xylosoxidans]
MSDIDPKIALDAALQRDSELERDFLTEILSSRTRAWRVAWTAIILALLSMFATASIFPLKEPPGMYVVRVDNATGTIEHVTMLGNGQEEYGERIARYFVHQYVLACEGYDWYTLQNTYDRCALFSSPEIQRAYFSKFEGDKGLDKVYADHTRIRVNVRSITLGPNHSATVRFTRRIESGNGPATAENLLATMAFQYVNTPISESVGRDNPLGFQVVSYTVDTETLR